MCRENKRRNPFTDASVVKRPNKQQLSQPVSAGDAESAYRIIFLKTKTHSLSSIAITGDATRVQCLLCGIRVQNMSIYRVHFYRNHTEYQENRRCHTCSQHFVDRPHLTTHLRGNNCPGLPVVYSKSNGKLYYYGQTDAEFLERSLFPRMKYNALVALGRCERYYQIIDANDPIVQYLPRDLPLGTLSNHDYVERNFRPAAPDFPKESEIVISNIIPTRVSELTRLCRKPRHCMAVKTTTENQNRKAVLAKCKSVEVNVRKPFDRRLDQSVLTSIENEGKTPVDSRSDHQTMDNRADAVFTPRMFPTSVNHYLKSSNILSHFNLHIQVRYRSSLTLQTLNSGFRVSRPLVSPSKTFSAAEPMGKFTIV